MRVKRLLQRLFFSILLVLLLPTIALADENDGVGQIQSGSTVYVNPLYPDAQAPAVPFSLRSVAPNSEEIPTCSTIEEAGAILREAMKNREETVSIGYASYENAAELEKLISDIIENSLVHTGVPTEGDYLHWHLDSISVNYSYESNTEGSIHNLVMKFNLLYYSTAEQEVELEAAVEQLLNELNLYEKSDYEKVRGIYDYICANVTYDHAHYPMGKEYSLMYTAYAALLDRTAVCQGYSNLFYRLALELGVDTRIINGYAGEDHAWNIVDMGEYYYYLDSTWDAGRNEYCYFLKGSEEFGSDHTPEATFLSEYPIDTENYVRPAPENPNEIVASGACGDTVNWTLTSDGKLTIAGDGEMWEFKQGAAPWYEYRSAITSLVIEDGVTDLGMYAFFECSALLSAELAESIMNLGSNTFRRCYSLQSINIPGSVTEIGDGFAADCWSLKSIVIPEGVTTIMYDAFRQCLALESVSIPVSVKAIYEYAFKDCHTLQTVYYAGNSVKWNLVNISRNNDVLLNASIIFGMDSPELGDMGEIIYFGTCGENVTWTLTENGYLTISGTGKMNDYNYNKLTPWYDYSDSIVSVIIEEGIENVGSYSFCFSSDRKEPNILNVILPDSLTVIGKNAFMFCDSLTNIIMSSSLKTIENGAFYGCTNLRAITIPDGLTTIGASAFHMCEKLVNIVIPNSVTDIGKGAFYSCNKLESVRLSEGMTTISAEMFRYCKSLYDIKIPNSVKSIGYWAFASCTDLETIEIPASVTSIGYGVFSNDIYLESIQVDNENQNYCSVDGVLFSKDMKKLICHPASRVLVGSYTIPDGVEVIESHAFDSCTLLLGVTIPNSVVYIGDDAFNFCYYLKRVTLPDSMVAISNRTFASCWGLEEVNIPATVTRIGEGAFYNCTGDPSIGSEGMKSVYYSGTQEQWNSIQIGIDNEPLLNAQITCSGDDEVIPEVPAVTINSGTCGNKLKWNVTNHGVLTISGSGKMDDFDLYSIPWYSNNASIIEVVIEDGVTNIGKHAFQYCDNLESITIPQSVTSIQERAFQFCSILKTIYYEGYKAQWAKVKINKNYNEHLSDAEIVFMGEPNHEHSEEVVLGKKATCTTSGITDGTKCSKCGVIMVDQVPTEALGHDYDEGIVTKVPTSTAAGEKTFTCKRNGCNHSYTEKIAVIAPTLEEPTVKASNVTSTGKIKLTWDKIAGAEKYEVWRATSKNGNYTKIYTTASTSLINTSVTAGEIYYYKVRAVSGNIKSAYSKIVSRSCDAARVKAKASNVASSGKIKLTWNEVAGATHYEVYRAASKTGTYKKLITTTKTSVTNTSTEAGKTYYYKVRAIVNGNTSANGAYSEIVSRCCDVAQVKLKASNVASSGKIKLTWNEVAGATHYEVYRAVSKAGTYKKLTMTTKLSVTNTSTEAGKTYYYKVRAVVSGNSSANGSYSEIVSRTCDVARPAVSIKLNSKNKPVVTWNAVSGAEKYELYRATSKTGTYKKLIMTTKTSVTNTSVDKGKTYYYKVRAISSVSSGDSAYSEIKSIKVK